MNRTKALDPALQIGEQRDESTYLTQFSVTREAVYIFDFDGVIASANEDRLYKAPLSDEERAFTAQAAHKLGVRCEGMDPRYQRHLVHQAALWFMDSPIAPGPLLEKAREANCEARLFILTARSGWYAVERCRDFLRANLLLPVETFHVGRTGKVAQVELVCNEFDDAKIFFIDDSIAHLKAVDLALGNRVSKVFVRDGLEEKESRLLSPGTDELRRLYVEVVQSAMENCN
ncbi:5'-nucleotidase [Paraburkholderia sp. 31.1]|uniref:hypothetical protein n=1 Tax=Paraburkholderia sp. 31.1 TaxID=2615205 RepID=UPI00165576C8|nr:hypothetical protein [Paraburkholderia sp. 31.1]MBC8725010.1 5'-nucleotidase [Paraburkholderia sp. 31.1]